MNRLTPLLLFMVMILSSCNKETNDYVTAFPFMETDNGKWGMITTDGEVLFSQEFKNQPTVVRNGMFLVKNEANLWEIYTAEKIPKKIGSEYTSATIFSNGRAIVCEKDKYITIIDTEGKTIKTLDEIDGKRINTVFRFQEGYAKYIAGEDYGVIDMDGNSVIPCNYCAIMDCSDGKFIAIDKKIQDGIQELLLRQAQIYCSEHQRGDSVRDRRRKIQPGGQIQRRLAAGVCKEEGFGYGNMGHHQRKTGRGDKTGRKDNGHRTNKKRNVHVLL